MGLIEGILALLFGSGRNVVRETAEVFLENREAAGARDAAFRAAALEQFTQEFVLPRQGLFDRFMDALNRVPRPALALGTLGLFIAAMADPIWFAARMQGIALVPEPLWWLMGAIVSFYFGARHQAKGQAFQRSLTETMARAGQVTQNLRVLAALETGAGREENPALDDWSARDGK
ncbi:holin family protein [Aliiroseovarius sp.]|uniref:holin family protein n=1 Tax=Aliiroseovarius sp. TaxID=1872442 RepID=UPI00260F71E9|nr:holin family protein [Aliiroseovarius sp.]